MEELKPLISAFPASGLIDSRLREKMETHYEKDAKEQTIKQPEASIPSAYSSDFIFEEKERILKDIYSSIKMFDKVIYEARKEIELKNKRLK